MILKGISSMATQALLAELVAAWTQETGVALAFESVGGVDAARRVQDGEVFDLVVLAEEAINVLAEAGLLQADSRVAIAASSVAIAVPAGAARPDVSSEEALRDAVLAARQIAYSTGPSGKAVLQLFERWGMNGILADKLLQARPGVPVAWLLAESQADLGFQQLSEMQGRPGIALLGGMPPGLEIVTRFFGAVGSDSTQKEAARTALAFMASPERGEIVERQGMARATPTKLS